VAPGKYDVAIRVPGVTRELSGQVTIESDPMERISAIDRRARQDALIRVYTLQQSLGAARLAAQALTGDQADALQKEVDRLIGIYGGLLRALEGFSSSPTADQRQQITWLSEDAARAIAKVNRLAKARTP
jgi:hypothetical protein